MVAMKADQCTASTTLESLRGKRACSTGYRKTAGWRMPIGRLLKDGVMDEVIHLLVARSRWGLLVLCWHRCLPLMWPCY